jgi:hypothetical protein
MPGLNTWGIALLNGFLQGIKRRFHRDCFAILRIEAPHCFGVEPTPLMAFIPQPGRDAQPTIDGYVYQVIATVLAWLNLAEGQHLELEAGVRTQPSVDEFADVSASPSSRIAADIDVHQPGAASAANELASLRAIFSPKT